MIVMALATVGMARPGLVRHDAVIDDGQLQWTTRAWGISEQVHPLAYPLPRETQAVPPTTEVQLRRDELGSVVAVVGSPVSLTLPHRDEALTVPLWSTHEVQRVDVRNARFRPDPASGFTKTVTGWLGPGLDRQRRRQADRAAGLRARATDPAIHLVLTPSLQQARGIQGTLSPNVKTSLWTWVILSALGVGLGMAGFWLYGFLQRRARAEQVDAYIAAEFDPER